MADPVSEGEDPKLVPHRRRDSRLDNANSSSQIASTTRYWDCSGGSCGCAYFGNDNEPTHCSSNAMFMAPSGNQYDAQFYGTAAVSEALGGGSWLSESCGRCWKLTGTSNTNAVTPPITTSVVLKGANFCPPSNAACANGSIHFDIAAPGFDFLTTSQSNTCSSRDPTEAQGYGACSEWMIASSDPSENCDCDAFNDPILRAGCNNFRSLHWNNVNVTYEEVVCPMELTRLPCWEENGNNYPEGIPPFCSSNIVTGTDGATSFQPSAAPSGQFIATSIPTLGGGTDTETGSSAGWTQQPCGWVLVLATFLIVSATHNSLMG